MTLRRAWMPMVAGVVAASLVGCATVPDEPEQESYFYFPEPPHPPRIQFLTSVPHTGVWSSGSERNSSFAEWVAGETPDSKPSTRIETPYGVGAYQGRVYICDVDRSTIHWMDVKTGAYGQMNTPEDLKIPLNITIDDRDGTKYVCDTAHRMIFVFDAEDNFVRRLGDPSLLAEPTDLAIHGDELYILDRQDGEIEVWSRQGERLRTIAQKGAGPDDLEMPQNLAIGPDERIYVTDSGGRAKRVKIFDLDGRYQGSIGQPGNRVGSFAIPKGIAIDPDGHIYVSDSYYGVVQIFNTDGQPLLVISGRPEGAPGVVLPAALAIDRTSLSAFQDYIDPDFDAEYLLFLINQRSGPRKLSIYAYGRSRSRPVEDYEIQVTDEDESEEEVRKDKDEPAD
ncbi:MAG: hypothetical protein ACOC9P_00090 [bacterium]